MLLTLAVLLGPALLEVGEDSRTPIGDGGELPIPSIAYGLIAFGLLMALLAVTYAFRSVGKRH